LALSRRPIFSRIDREIGIPGPHACSAPAQQAQSRSRRSHLVRTRLVSLAGDRPRSSEQNGSRNALGGMVCLGRPSVQRTAACWLETKAPGAKISRGSVLRDVCGDNGTTTVELANKCRSVTIKAILIKRMAKKGMEARRNGDYLNECVTRSNTAYRKLPWRSERCRSSPSSATCEAVDTRRNRTNRAPRTWIRILIPWTSGARNVLSRRAASSGA
jgi:hypothetical protein